MCSVVGRQPSGSWPVGGSRCPRDALTAAAAAPLVGLDDAAHQDRATRVDPLPEDLEAELIEAAERGQVRESEGSVRHAEVFRIGSTRTPITGRPREPLIIECSRVDLVRWSLGCP